MTTQGVSGLKRKVVKLLLNHFAQLIFAAASLMQILLPSRIASSELRQINDEIVIKIDQASPPYSAFNEVINDDQKLNEWSKAKTKASVDLVVGSSNKDLLKLLAQQPIRQVVVEEMLVTKPQTAQVQLEELVIAQQQKVPSRTVAQVLKDSDLSRKEKIRLQIAQERYAILSQDWSQPAHGGQIEEKLSEIKEEQGQPSSIYIRGKQGQTQVPQATVVAAPKSYADARMKTSNNIDDNGLSTQGLVGSPSTTIAMMAPLSQDPVNVSGSVEVSGGLAHTGNDHIEVWHVSDGIAQEVAEVDPTSPEFIMDAASSNGVLIASLVSQEGEIKGRGVLKLSDTSNNLTSKGVLSGLKLKIKPFMENMSGQILSAYSTRDNELPLPKAHLIADNMKIEGQVYRHGQFQIPGPSGRSQMQLRAENTGFWPTKTISVMGETPNVYLYPNSMMQAFWDLVQEATGEEAQPSQEAIIWGRIFNGDTAVAGVQVESENALNQKVIYFNRLLIPDINLTATTESGYFAIINLEPGFHHIIAHKNEKYFSHGNAIVEPGVVSQVTMRHSTQLDPVSIKTYDAFTGQPINAELVLQSQQEILQVSGQTKIFLPRLTRLSFLLATSGSEYEESIHNYIDDTDHVHVPMIRKQWLDSLRSEVKIDDATYVGRVVGFVQDEDYDVYLAGDEDYLAHNIVYFDAAGRVSPKGVAGGGFVMFNVPDGAATVVVIGKKTEKIHSQIINVDGRMLNVLQYRLLTF